ncbi:family A G protein-coupled receptor-like protein [Choiromyces venosus 120613-1]|uniref:Family A G protein-coupled receptor-like protein n=1 Tax=Choiromyces venosus 120613-1 TaxID=1336337 RepID=A0A3N4JI33_9PEZI|nr:family A G protein-coupled receptor-like protein [Choiromyces venosus 120613-1]
MTGITGIRLAVSILTLIGSSLSALGAGFICLCYLFLPLKAHFRHRLIQSLALADFLNASSTSTSGFYILARNRELPEGVGCKVNGLVTQITVQATDLSILAIALVTVWAITKPSTFSRWSTRKGILTVCIIWVFPFITGFTALAKDWYHPVSGNWCWIQKKPAYIRYALTHGWRFFVIFTVIALYTYLHFFLRDHFSELRDASNGSTGTFRSRLQRDLLRRQNEQQQGRTPPCPPPVAVVSTASGPQGKSHAIKQSYQDSDYGKKVSKVLLMKAYPTFYVILWIPGIANRLVEASGRSSTTLQLMQASTQFVGLANAITYGWNERIWVQLKRRFASPQKPSPGSYIV